MCNNLYLHEKQVERHLQDLQHEANQQRIVARLHGQQHSGQMYSAPNWKHIVSRLGTHMVALGTWLERVEQHEKQAVATYK